MRQDDEGIARQDDEGIARQDDVGIARQDDDIFIVILSPERKVSWRQNL